MEKPTVVPTKEKYITGKSYGGAPGIPVTYKTVNDGFLIHRTNNKNLDTYVTVLRDDGETGFTFKAGNDGDTAWYYATLNMRNALLDAYDTMNDSILDVVLTIITFRVDDPTYRSVTQEAINIIEDNNALVKRSESIDISENRVVSRRWGRHRSSDSGTLR